MGSPKCNKRFIVCLFTIIVIFIFADREARSTTINISVSDFVFAPSNVNVFVGDTVKWTWIGARAHTTTCDGLFPGTVLPAGAAPWDSPLNGGSPIFSYVIEVEGTYEYVCTFHSVSNNMVGTIVAETPLPVELTDFVATTIKNEVILDWATGGEINNEKFEIQRFTINNEKDLSLDLNLDLNDLPFTTIGVLQGNGTSNEIHNYKYVDRNLKSGIYLYRLKQVDFNSNFIYHLLQNEVVIGIPNKFNLSQNYPNPFNPTTRINFELPENGIVSILLFDISGKVVSTILNTDISAGYQSVEVNGANLSSGVYYYRIDFRGENGSQTDTKRMMLIK